MPYVDLSCIELYCSVMAVQTTTARPGRRMSGVRIDRRVLKIRRQVSGLNLAQLGAAAGISAGYARHIESGRRATVSPAVFARICDALAVQDRTELMVLDQEGDGDR
jgi:DNA-binding Xre family transcriptional regulator